MTPSARELVVATSGAVYGVSVRVAGPGPAADAAAKRAFERAFEQLPGYGGDDLAAWVSSFIAPHPPHAEPQPMPAPLLQLLLDQADAIERRAAAERVRRSPVPLRPRSSRLLALGVAAAAVLASTAVYTWWPAAKKHVAQTPGVEPTELEPGVLLPDSFGDGIGTRWQRGPGGEKELTFELPGPSAAVLYFDGTGAIVEVNGIGLVPDDTVLGQEIVLPVNALRTGKNVLTFHGARSDWRVENVWLYTFEIKEKERDDLPAVVMRRMLAATNGYEIDPIAAWRACHDVRLFRGSSMAAKYADPEWFYEEQIDTACEKALERGQEVAIYDRPDLGCFRKVRDPSKHQR